MYRYIFRFIVTTLTILTANLLTTWINDYMVSFRADYKPLTFTLIGMLVIVVVFYPLFIKLEKWIERFSVRMIRSGKSMAGKYLGLLLTFIASMVVLSYFYAKMWYNIDLVRILFQGNIGGVM